jgi:hypothetical protein
LISTTEFSFTPSKSNVLPHLTISSSSIGGIEGEGTPGAGSPTSRRPGCHTSPISFAQIH